MDLVALTEYPRSEKKEMAERLIDTINGRTIQSGHSIHRCQSVHSEVN